MSDDASIDRATDTGEHPQPATVERMLHLVRDNALQLLAGFPQPPSALRVEAGGVTVEVEWSAAPPVANGGGAPSIEASGLAAVGSPAAGASAGQAPAAVVADDRRYLCAPMVGAFFRAPEPGAKPFVEVGDTVVVGQQVGIVEAMKLMIPVNADLDGRVVEILKDNGESVEYGERLFALSPLS